MKPALLLLPFFAAVSPGAAAVVLAVDVDERTAGASTGIAGTTAAGFQSFVIGGTADPNTTSPTTIAYGAFSVTVGGVAGTATAVTTGTSPNVGFGGAKVPNYSDRRRTAGSPAGPLPANSGSFTGQDLLSDFLFSNDNNNGGLDIIITGLAVSTPYIFEVWSYDASSLGTRVSDWTANGSLVADDYSFTNTAVGVPAPADDNFGKFSFTATTGATGQILLSGRRTDASRNSAATPAIDVGVFLNGFRISTVPEPTSALLGLSPLAGLALRRRRA
ncbi:MAG: hypothetical protein V4726_12980 [Verrucomicrobiota bacterium]